MLGLAAAAAMSRWRYARGLHHSMRSWVNLITQPGGRWTKAAKEWFAERAHVANLGQR